MGRPKNDKEWREEIAQKFIEVLETEGLNWKRSWIRTGMPVNGGTKRPYHGINAFMLGLIAMHNGWGRRWYTWNQITDPKHLCHPEEKWHLMKDTKAVYVEYWYPYDTVNRKMLSWKEHKRLIDGGRDSNEFTLRATFTAVYNESRIEGISAEVVKTSDVKDVSDTVLKIAGNMGLEIRYDGGDRAFYRPSDDTLHLPKPEQFFSQKELNATALHELGHATGHETRLNRNLRNLFGTDAYAYEELVAEMTSCFVSIRLPEEEDEEMMRNHQAYIQSWVSGLKDKPKALSDAIKDAMAAAAYMDKMAGIETETEHAEDEPAA